MALVEQFRYPIDRLPYDVEHVGWVNYSLVTLRTATATLAGEQLDPFTGRYEAEDRYIPT